MSTNALVNAIENMQNVTQTENGAVAYKSTLSSCLDLFFKVGSMRGNNVLPYFRAAFNEDRALAASIMLWSRDIREGAGERDHVKNVIFDLFTNIETIHNYHYLDLPFHENTFDALKGLANERQCVLDDFHMRVSMATSMFLRLPELGCWSDVFDLYERALAFNENMKRELIEFHSVPYSKTLVRSASLHMIEVAELLIKHALVIEGNGLAAKWAPRKGYVAARLRRALGLTPKSYRNLIVSKTKVVEQKMCAKDWGNIDFSSVPSLASLRYAKAFAKNCSNEYTAWLEKAKEGKVKVNAGAVYPYQIIRSETPQLADAMWEALPDYTKGKNILPVIDVSGSMFSIGASGIKPVDVSVSLGLYCALKNKGAFSGLFVTFSENPEFIKLNSKTISEAVSEIESSYWGMNTDLLKVFKKLLKMCLKNNVPQEDLPEKILIFSDMQFDDAMSEEASDKNSLDLIRDEFVKNGYVPPQIVFWNLAAKSNVPVTVNDKGVALVSGFSPSVMSSVLMPGVLDPVSVMLSTVRVERYKVAV